MTSAGTGPSDRSALSYRELLVSAAAGRVRNIQPRPSVGFPRGAGGQFAHPPASLARLDRWLSFFGP
jgi:hypothetical protein